MRTIVVGLGVQGKKRRHFLGNDFISAVDPFNIEAQYRELTDVPLDSFDAAMLCVPDEPKIKLIRYLLNHGKHVLVEKPLWAEEEQDIFELERLAKTRHLICYTAYNHRFEPHIARMKTLLDSGVLGSIYHCRLFYGNGTARLVKDSLWRDQGAGVLPDLGSHLLDLLHYWFKVGNKSDSFGSDNFALVFSHCFENRAPDHVVIKANGAHCDNAYSFPTAFELEMSLLAWRNHFSCDIYAEKGSAHISSLCKWGPSQFIYRKRILPSGRPEEESIELVEPDSTWAGEYAYFKKRCSEMNPATDLSKDLWLNKVLKRLGNEAIKEANRHSRKNLNSQNSEIVVDSSCK